MLDIVLCDNIESIGRERWNALCGTDYPFLRYEFLHALERSGSTGGQSGWQPCHLALHDGDTPVFLMPLYLKTHSYGEYVFDWSWADAYQRYGYTYYPKLVSAIPFTPAYGPRFGTSLSESALAELLQQVIPEVTRQLNASSWHMLFPQQHQMEMITNPDFMPRLGAQYHWFNRNYRDFAHFLESFSSRKRKNLRKERDKVIAQGITLHTYQGHQISDQLLYDFYRFYQNTYLKRGRRGYLTPDFFTRLRDSMPEQLVLVVAQKEGSAVAAALSLRSSTTLYGRYWGCQERFDNLHFETCYYQGIEYCIREGLTRFDPGAQGEHKISRGFTPIETWSLHYIDEPAFRQPIARFLAEEQDLMREQIAELTTWLPFRH